MGASGVAEEGGADSRRASPDLKPVEPSDDDEPRSILGVRKVSEIVTCLRDLGVAVGGETSGDGDTAAGLEVANGGITPSPERPATAGLEAANGIDEAEGWEGAFDTMTR